MKHLQVLTPKSALFSARLGILNTRLPEPTHTGDAKKILDGLTVLPVKEEDAFIWFDPETLMLIRVSPFLWSLSNQVREAKIRGNTPLDDAGTAAFKEINNLIETGFLSFSDKSGGNRYDLDFEEGLETLYLYLGTACDLECTYCSRHFGGVIKGTMKMDTIRTSIDMLFRASRDKNPINIVFTGGEPLLFMEMIEKTLTYTRYHPEYKKKEVRFGLTTNGTHITKQTAALLARPQYNFSVVLSFDGPKEIHDTNRIRKDGSGTYTDVAKAFLLLKKYGLKRLFLRATIPPEFMHRTVDIVEHLASFEPLGVMIQPDLTAPWQAGGKKLPGEDNYIESLAQMAASYPPTPENTGKKYPHILTKMVQALDRLEYRDYGCGAALNMAAVSPNGDIFPCSWLSSLPGWRIGNIKKGFDEHMRNKCRSQLSQRRETCEPCFAKHLCGGGCVAGTALVNGDIGIPLETECRIFRAAARMAIGMAVRSKLTNRRHHFHSNSGPIKSPKPKQGKDR